MEGLPSHAAAAAAASKVSLLCFALLCFALLACMCARRNGGACHIVAATYTLTHDKSNSSAATSGGGGGGITYLGMYAAPPARTAAPACLPPSTWYPSMFGARVLPSKPLPSCLSCLFVRPPTASLRRPLRLTCPPCIACVRACMRARAYRHTTVQCVAELRGLPYPVASRPRRSVRGRRSRAAGALVLVLVLDFFFSFKNWSRSLGP
ncbi:uncharacterized protein K452DRAFT_53575 [Aplosporella prunicola CBS 121167]|uniref:Uncharacterized protein n=1 Tax=Aplosporella prunicola CBS 121167 TaxID=1176127 RepID=A0A6A6BA62_9PEZI|nr:uncharacterized protein K452DRAFT_53575 [Aplosporella prunicola CBS 121167]KAF2140263.1 hypothetical protein K452DRAFT_53575 [Aplosporella prunicola CBS 121167]